MSYAITTRTPQALRRSGVTSAYRSYTALVMVAPTATLERGAYHYLLRIPLPGVLRHTLALHLKDDTLVVSGAWEGGDASGAVFFGSVYRAVPLPADAIPTGFKSRLEADSFVISVPRHI